MSLSTTFSHVIFGLPLPLLPSTVIFILFFTQSFPYFLNTCPIHLSLLHLITSLIFSMPILSLNSAFVFFSLSDTPHIHLTILISALSSFASCSAFGSLPQIPKTFGVSLHGASSRSSVRTVGESYTCVCCVAHALPEKYARVSFHLFPCEFWPHSWRICFLFDQQKNYFVGMLRPRNTHNLDWLLFWFGKKAESCMCCFSVSKWCCLLVSPPPCGILKPGFLSHVSNARGCVTR